jgi:hypothetical protein
MCLAFSEEVCSGFCNREVRRGRGSCLLESFARAKTGPVRYLWWVPSPAPQAPGVFLWPVWLYRISCPASDLGS